MITLLYALTLVCLALGNNSKQCQNVSGLAPGSLRPKDGCAKTYLVQPGDTCDSILFSDEDAFSLDEFLAANPSVNDECTNLQPGSRVCVSGPSDLCDGSLTIDEGCKKFRRVKEGDTCESIVNSIGDITLDDFLSFNPQVDTKCSNLQPGLQYCSCNGGEPLDEPIATESLVPLQGLTTIDTAPTPVVASTTQLTTFGTFFSTAIARRHAIRL